MSENVIEFNGKRYDAVTGVYLGKSHSQATPATPEQAGRTIDGFIRPAHKPKTAPADALITAAPKPTAPAARRHPQRPHTHAHQPQHATTLMRAAVHKPSAKKLITAQAPAEVAAKLASALAHKRSVAHVDPARLARAQNVAKHQAVQRFHTPTGGRTAGDHLAVSMQHGPVPIMPVRPAPAHHAARPAHHLDPLESAFRQATSHQQPPHKHRARSRRLTNALAGIAVFVVLGGFIAYLNLPNIELHIASAQAGFRAGMPSYHPTGYALAGAVKHAGGTVSIHFASGDSSYTITQQASDWNSQTLLDSTLALSGAHQAVHKSGETIYLYGNGATAAWVSGGIRYDMTGNADLTGTDIVSIATSL